MSNINLGIRFANTEVTSRRVRYARIDNTNTYLWTTVGTNPTTSPAVIATNIENGQYAIESVGIYPDGRTCPPRTYYTPSCEGLISINAYISSNNLIVEYLAPSGTPKVRITVDYPNNGQNVANYVNTGTPIVIGLPTGVNGDFFVTGQSVCDEASEFFSPKSNQVSVTRNSNPTITQVNESDTGTGGTRTQIFSIGDVVTSGNRFTLSVYSHAVEIIAVIGDTPSSIAIKLRDAINATSEATWNDHGGAPVTGTVGFKPTATASGNQVIVVLDYQHQFGAMAYVS